MKSTSRSMHNIKEGVDMHNRLSGELLIRCLSLRHLLNICISGDEDEEDIFARYEIDKSKNDGLDYCYDEVVRKKKERQKLHGTDCPCCRDVHFGRCFSVGSLSLICWTFLISTMKLLGLYRPD